MDRPEESIFGRWVPLHSKTNSIQEAKHHINKHGGGSIVIWAASMFCFVAPERRRPAVNTGTTSPALQPSVCDVKFKHIWVFHRHSVLKHSSKSTSEKIKTEKNQ